MTQRLFESYYSDGDGDTMVMMVTPCDAVKVSWNGEIIRCTIYIIEGLVGGIGHEKVKSQQGGCLQASVRSLFLFIISNEAFEPNRTLFG